MQGGEIAGRELRKKHIEEAATNGGTTLDKVKVFRGENDALEHSHHLCEARRTLAVNKDLLTFFARCQQLDRNIMGSVAFFQRDPASGHILISCDDLFILRGAVAAAKGAVVNRFQQIWHVTLPGLKDTFFVLFLLSISNILSSGFDHYFVFNNPMVSDKLMVLDLWTYQLGIGQADYSYSIAVGIIRTFVSLILLFTANGISKKIRGYSIV